MRDSADAAPDGRTAPYVTSGEAAEAATTRALDPLADEALAQIIPKLSPLGRVECAALRGALEDLREVGSGIANAYRSLSPGEESEHASERHAGNERESGNEAAADSLLYDRSPPLSPSEHREHGAAVRYGLRLFLGATVAVRKRLGEVVLRGNVTPSDTTDDAAGLSMGSAKAVRRARVVVRTCKIILSSIDCGRKFDECGADVNGELAEGYAHEGGIRVLNGQVILPGGDLASGTAAHGSAATGAPSPPSGGARPSKHGGFATMTVDGDKTHECSTSTSEGSPVPKGLARALQWLEATERSNEFLALVERAKARTSEDAGLSEDNFSFGSTPFSSWKRVVRAASKAASAVDGTQLRCAVLGSSTGRLVLFTAFLKEEWQCVGIEILSVLHRIALRAVEKSQLSNARLECGDARVVDLRPYRMIVLASLCWDADLHEQLVQRVKMHCCKGTVIVDYCARSMEWFAAFATLERKMRIPTSWAPNQPVFIYTTN